MITLCIEKEVKEIQARCETQDIDFEFLIDSSGSIGAEAWRTAVVSIADDWIINAIKPVNSEFGNHVAARWFSSSSDIFINFQLTGENPGENLNDDESFSDGSGELSGDGDPSMVGTVNDYLAHGNGNYPAYIANIMRNADYNSGGTDTANGLNQIYNTDLNTSRHLEINKTIVFVFTDGYSNNEAETIAAAKQLQKKATLFSVAIGDSVNTDELDAIATKGKVMKIDKVEDIKPLMNGIMSDNAVCGEYECTNIFRGGNANPMMMRTKGCSKKTGEGMYRMS